MIAGIEREPLLTIGRGPGFLELRIEPCACGGHISAARDVPQAIAAAVQVHNQTAGHQLWRRRVGIL